MLNIHRNHRRTLNVFVVFVSILLCNVLPVNQAVSTESEPEFSFTLWQLPSMANSHSMAYVIETADDSVIVIDGGRPDETWYLRQFFDDHDIDRVDHWFLSHIHWDHLGALTVILGQENGIEIGTIHASLPYYDWLEILVDEPGAGVDDWTIRVYDRFLVAVAESSVPVDYLEVGDIVIDNLTFEVLRVWNPDITTDAVNNSCILLRVTDGANSILFTGDLSYIAGYEVINEDVTPGITERIQSDFVQISHHASYGVDEEFYRLVDPDYTLWPAPSWRYHPEPDGPEPDRWCERLREYFDSVGIGEDRRFISTIDGLTGFRFTVPPTQPGLIYIENPEARGVYENYEHHADE